jgi:hypothetical protein
MEEDVMINALAVIAKILMIDFNRRNGLKEKSPHFVIALDLNAKKSIVSAMLQEKSVG